MSATRRHRGLHSTVCKNPNPTYTAPERSRLPFLADVLKASQSKNVTLSDVAVLMRKQIGRKKRFYRDRENAIRALHSVMSDRVNLVTFQVEISLRNASDAAGLTTVSPAEVQKGKDDPFHTPVVSISRASRALQDMIDMGWIIAKDEWQVWDKEAGAWSDKYYEATPLFFKACGITEERLLKQQSQRLAYLKHQATSRGLSPEAVGRMSIAEIKAERKLQWRRNAFERRGKEMARKKASRALHEKTRQEQREVAQKRVLSSLSHDELQRMDARTYESLVNKEIAGLRKFAGVSPPIE
ncbi:plasmid replication initiator RepA [Photobacterium damselae]|uniref:plasmid replication initiator RepA n=1 Tax=Photobacterium damselae TaxID=38293 RepID=UPI002F409D19